MDEDYSLHKVQNGWILEINTSVFGQMSEKFYPTRAEAVSALIEYLQGKLSHA